MTPRGHTGNGIVHHCANLHWSGCSSRIASTRYDNHSGSPAPPGSPLAAVPSISSSPNDRLQCGRLHWPPPEFTSSTQPCFGLWEVFGSLTATSWLYKDSASTLNSPSAPPGWPARSSGWSGIPLGSSRFRRTSTTVLRPSDPPWTSRLGDQVRECRSKWSRPLASWRERPLR